MDIDVGDYSYSYVQPDAASGFGGMLVFISIFMLAVAVFALILSYKLFKKLHIEPPILCLVPIYNMYRLFIAGNGDKRKKLYIALLIATPIIPTLSSILTSAGLLSAFTSGGGGILTLLGGLLMFVSVILTLILGILMIITYYRVAIKLGASSGLAVLCAIPCTSVIGLAILVFSSKYEMADGYDNRDPMSNTRTGKALASMEIENDFNHEPLPGEEEAPRPKPQPRPQKPKVASLKKAQPQSATPRPKPKPQPKPQAQPQAQSQPQPQPQPQQNKPQFTFEQVYKRMSPDQQQQYMQLSDQQKQSYQQKVIQSYASQGYTVVPSNI